MSAQRRSEPANGPDDPCRTHGSISRLLREFAGISAPVDVFNHPRYSKSLAIGLGIVGCFRSGQQPLGIHDIAEALGLGRSTTHRYAATLVAVGWLEQTPKRKYRLAHRSAWPGMSVLGEIVRVSGCEPVLRELRAQTGHTASLGVLEGTRATYVQRLSAHGKGQHEADGELRAGAHVPLHCTALGRALLAGLPKMELEEVLAGMELVRHRSCTITGKRALRALIQQAKDADGLAVSDREFIGHECAVAVAVPRPADGWCLAVELNAPVVSTGLEELTGYAGQLVRDAAVRIGETLKASVQNARSRAGLCAKYGKK